MAQTLLNSYLNLPLDGRDAALTTLIRSLGQRDRDFVQNLICDARDPFYRLPIELLINIFDSLHPFDVWTKRLVCRRWKTVLSADKFTRTAIKRFDTHEPEDSALDAEVAAFSPHTSAIRHILALRYGRPFSYVKISDEFTCVPSSHPVTHLIRLKGKHLAYLRGNPKTREGNTVIVRDLVSGGASSLCGSAREKIMSVHLTAEIVAFLTYAGTIYVASLLDLTNSLRCIRLPSSSVLATSSCRATVACLLQGSSRLTTVIYDAETRRTHSFALQAVHGPSVSPGCYTILVDSQKQCIDVFIFRKAKKKLGPRIEVSRYLYAGEMSTGICFEMQPETSMAENVSIGSVEPTGECGIYQIPLKYEGGRLYKGGHWLTRWTLIYDATSMALKAIDCFYARSRCDHNDLPKPALWKDRLYRGDKRPLLISTARRLASIDGPHALRKMRNEAKPDYGELGFDYMAEEEEEEEEEEESDADKTKDSMLAQPMSVRSWKEDYQLFAQRYLQWARLQDQPADLSDFNTPNNRHPFKEFGQDTQGYVISPSKEGPELFHTIVAMNDTFAVGTCHSHGCVGVVCFDERVALHGAGSTFLWDELDSQLRCGSGPGLLRFVTDPDSDSDSEMDSE